MSNRVLAFALMPGLLGAASVAAEPLILSKSQLDSVTAAADAGFLVSARSATGSNRAESFAGLLNVPGLVDAETLAVSPDGAAGSRIGGPVLFSGTRNAALALGFFVGSEASTGDGATSVDATPIAVGDIAVGERIIAPVGRQSSLVLGIALAIDLPTPRLR